MLSSQHLDMSKEECADGQEGYLEERKSLFPKREGQRTLGIPQRKEERSTLEKGWSLSLAREDWHGLVGPADFMIPDNPRELIYSGLGGAVYGAASYVMTSAEVTRSLKGSQMAAHHIARVYAANPGSVYPKAALRVMARRQIVRGSFVRGALIVGLSLNPAVSLLLTAYFIASSIPPDIRDASGMTSYETYLAGGLGRGVYDPHAESVHP